jgi:ATP-dependent protease ClpP protease subunit
MKTPKNLHKSRQPAANQLRPCFKVALVQGTEDLEILVYDEIGEYFDWDTYETAGVSSKSVRQALDAAGTTFSRIKLRINSPGGDAFEGVAIGNILKASGKPIDVFIDGLAASAASIIAMCGTTITMASNAMQMVHQAWSYCVGNSTDMRKMADTLDAIDMGSVAQTYVDRTSLSMEEVMALLNAETWLSARDCVDKGFATAIAKDANEPAMNMARNFRALASMRGVPEALRPSASVRPIKNDGMDDECQCPCPQCTSGDCAGCSGTDCGDPNCIDCPIQCDVSAKATATANLKIQSQKDLDLCEVTAGATRARLSRRAT